MLIGKRYKIESDALNITLYEKKITEKGKKIGTTYWDVIGYYATVEDALKGLVRLKVRESELKDLRKIDKAFKDAIKEIESMLKSPQVSKKAVVGKE